MQQIPDDPKQVAETALRYEAEGHRILRDAEEKSVAPLSKATFQFLADQEIKHIEAIKAFAASLEGAGGFDPGGLDVITLAKAGEQIKGIFAQFKSEFEKAGAEGERLDVYGVALDMERRGHDFYQAAADGSTDETSRKLYRFLADEEIKHFQIIQDTRDFLKQPDALMAIEERWMTT